MGCCLFIINFNGLTKFGITLVMIDPNYEINANTRKGVHFDSEDDRLCLFEHSCGNMGAYEGRIIDTLCSFPNPRQ